MFETIRFAESNLALKDQSRGRDDRRQGISAEGQQRQQAGRRDHDLPRAGEADTLVLDIVCHEPEMKKLNAAADVHSGDCVGRQRVIDLDKSERQAFSPTQGGWHLPTKFGKLVPDRFVAYVPLRVPP